MYNCLRSLYCDKSKPITERVLHRMRYICTAFNPPPPHTHLLTCQRLIFRFTGVPLEKSMTSPREQKVCYHSNMAATNDVTPVAMATG
jgi:hypothetical protein